MSLEDPGVPLPANRRTPRIVAVLSLVGWVLIAFALVEVFTADSLKRQILAVLVVAVLTLLFVVAPVVYLWFVRTFQVRVGTQSVAWTRNGVAERVLRFHDLTEVWANAGSRGPMGTNARSLTLNGTGADGEPVQIHVGRNLVSSLAPLLTPVAAEISRRPQLTGSDPQSFTDLMALETS